MWPRHIGTSVLIATYTFYCYCYYYKSESTKTELCFVPFWVTVSYHSIVELCQLHKYINFTFKYSSHYITHHRCWIVFQLHPVALLNCIFSPCNHTLCVHQQVFQVALTACVTSYDISSSYGLQGVNVHLELSYYANSLITATIHIACLNFKILSNLWYHWNGSSVNYYLQSSEGCSS